MISIRIHMLALSAGAALMLAFAMPAPASATSANGGCAPSKVKYVVYDAEGTQQHTGSANFKNISQATANISVPDGGGCVIVRFSAQTFAMNSEIAIRAIIDEASFASPAEVIYSGIDSGDTSRAYAFDFVFPNVSGGGHQIKMQYRSTAAGENVFISSHSMIVQY